MLKHYFKTAWRNAWRNKVFSAINIGGLALGIAFSLLILFWVQDELRVDGYHANGSRLYQVYEREYYDGKIDGNYDTPPLLAAELKKQVPEIVYATTLEEDNETNTFQVGNKALKESGTAARPDIFNMFSYPLLAGTPQSALNGPSDIAISRKMAAQFFGDPQAAIGKTIRFDNLRDFVVTGVFEDLRKNSSRRFDYLMSWEAFVKDKSYMNGWGLGGPRTFVQLRQDADARTVEHKITHFLDQYIKPTKAYHLEYGLQKFGETYLHGSFINGVAAGGRIVYVSLFSIIAVFIILIACINFMNLTTARSIKRAREIGVRKVAGAVRSVLILQFIGEAFLLTLLAVFLALGIVHLLLPVFNGITQKQLVLPFHQFSFWLQLAVLTLVTGIISGSYPALFLSSFNAVNVLKGIAGLPAGAVWFRKGLVVFQFILSMVLIIGTTIVSKQIHFIQNRNLGYEKKNLIDIPMEGALRSDFEVFKNEALKMPGIQMITHLSDDPTNLDDQNNEVDWDGRNPNTKVQFSTTVIGYDFISTMKLNLLQGRDFSPAFPSDSTGFIINETAMKRMGYTEPIGRRITFGPIRGHVVGVVKDFNFESLHKTIEPLIMRFDKTYGYELLVRTQPGKTKEALASLETLCKNLNPNFPFTYTFTDEAYLKLYRSEQVAGKLASAFAFLAILISCLGLLGLAIFTAEQRVKEIGIRKVLGANARSLFVLLSTEFLGLVLAALIIASPLAWYAVNNWLQGFAYHTTVGWGIFALAGLTVMAIALLTISFQIIKVTLLNPAKSLRGA